jgi:hypothetical protein
MVIAISMATDEMGPAALQKKKKKGCEISQES